MPDKEFSEWDDEEIYTGGQQLSLYGMIRDRLRTFLLQKKVENFILGMVIILCIVIFLELSIEDQID
jgi:hypothetical protein